MSDFQLHQCKFLGPGIRIEKSRSYLHDRFTWQLVISREATEDDLENNHFLETVGEQLWSAVVIALTAAKG